MPAAGSLAGRFTTAGASYLRRVRLPAQIEKGPRGRGPQRPEDPLEDRSVFILIAWQRLHIPRSGCRPHSCVIPP
ncbi:hypothetical protein CO2235_150265 [Cupriavidus oxalaticus]|uniref:Uncharacterized protein n=1 Tax=Cupriavidus oxalaticus TaxID=96344 RepID=A0A375FZ84_9BURK|nr:hypothetical protein CO2235_150265 [Cupriavidus oxalaticus]